LINLSYVQ